MGNPSGMGTYFSGPVEGTGHVHSTHRKLFTGAIDDDAAEGGFDR